MKTKFFSMAAMAALTIAGMASCSNDDEMTSQAQLPLGHKSAISFYGQQDGAVATRGIATTSANFLSRINNFMVFGYNHTGGADSRYVGASDTEGVIINGDGTGNWSYDNDAQTQYWPQFKLDFQAVTPASDASFYIVNTPVSGSPRLTANVTVPAAVADQKDIMFASALDMNNATTGLPVGLTFKHALSQVVFAGKVARPSIKADVASIELVNIYNTGNVGYRAAAGALSAATTGNAASTFAVGLVANATIPSTATDAAVNLTADDGALMMLPQNVNKWTTAIGAPVTTASANATHNSYLKITCTVTDVNSGKKLIDNGSVYIPFEVAWEQGKKYTYTLVFGNGTGGFDEDGNPLTSMVPITYTVDAADDWTAADGGEVGF